MREIKRAGKNLERGEINNRTILILKDFVKICE